MQETANGDMMQVGVVLALSDWPQQRDVPPASWHMARPQPKHATAAVEFERLAAAERKRG